MQNTEKNTFRSDRDRSTFRWEINLTPGHPENRVPRLDGYSCGQGHERTNKHELLLLKLGYPLLTYLPKADSIVVYLNDPALPKHQHPVLVELYPQTYHTYSWVKEDPFIQKRLHEHYSFLHQGITPERPPLLQHRISATAFDEDLNHAKRRFRNFDELVEFCRTRKVRYGHQLMKGWYYRHLEFQPELAPVQAPLAAPAAGPVGTDQMTLADLTNVLATKYRVNA